MRIAAGLLLICAPVALFVAFWATPGVDPVEAAFRRFDDVQRPFVRRRAEDVQRLPPDYEQIVSLLPQGYWGLLIDAYPDRAFARYAPVYVKGGDEGILARWALVRLAERGHRGTFDFFRSRLDSADAYERGLAVRMLAHAGDPALTPRLLAMLPKEIRDGEDSERANDLLKALTSCAPSDPEAVETALLRFRDFWKDGSPYSTELLRLRFAITTAAVPAEAARKGLEAVRRKNLSLESFEEWLAEFAVRRRLPSMAPVLRLRVRQEIALYVAEEDEDKLFPAEAEPMLAQFDAFWGFRGPFLLASYRRALRDLGVPLTREERDWLEAHRLLRPPREYLVEAGYLPR